MLLINNHLRQGYYDHASLLVGWFDRSLRPDARCDFSKSTVSIFAKFGPAVQYQINFWEVRVKVKVQGQNHRL